MLGHRTGLLGDVVAPSFVRGVTQAFGLLTRREKVQAIFIVLSMNINAMLGLVGLAGILPFVRLMLDPAPLEGEGWMARTFRAIGITDVNNALLWFGVSLVLMMLVKNVYGLIHLGFQNRFCARAEARLATDLLDRVVNAPYVWLVTRNSSILRDVVVGQSIGWSRGVIRPTLQIINDALFMMVALLLLVVASPAAGLVVSVSAILLGALMSMLSRPRIAFHAERKRKAIQLAGVTALEAIAGGRDVRMSGAGPMLVRSFGHDMMQYADGDSSSRLWQGVPRLGVEVIGFASLVGVALGALWSGSSRADVAALLALYAVVAVRAIPIISQLVIGISGVVDSLPAVAEVRELQTVLPRARPIDPGAKPIAWNRLALEEVEVVYPGAARTALGPLSLAIERGRSYGIVGASGAGKSTLVDIVAGLLPPTGGNILIDGEPLTPKQAPLWRRRVAYVAQNPFLIDASLAENIEFGMPALPDRVKRIDEVIAAAGLGDVLRGLPNGTDTRLGERGMLLSGGQRQRVAIARALYRDADILILDEATSALDSLTEREITDAVDALKGRLTLIVVAHRLSTIAHLDEILILDEGLVAGRGAHLELLAGNPLYQNFVAAQSMPGHRELAQ